MSAVREVYEPPAGKGKDGCAGGVVVACKLMTKSLCVNSFVDPKMADFERGRNQLLELFGHGVSQVANITTMLFFVKNT